MGFTDLSSSFPSGKALPILHYDDEFVVASIDKIQKMLLNRPHSHFVFVNTVDRPAVAVNTYTLVNTIPSGTDNVIGQNRRDWSKSFKQLFGIFQSQDYCRYHILYRSVDERLSELSYLDRKLYLKLPTH